MDRVVKHIAGTTTTNILNEMKKSPSGAFISDLYGKIVGKEISVKIDLTEANLNGDNNIYEAVDIFDPSVQQRGAVEVVHGIELFQMPSSSNLYPRRLRK
ncbi:hypothetical protein DCAR_0311715 [Daucus carota subsp. sativus]|uniref:Uncharacterized protein n=1 Tax=Daucus carota subsp. sativus TaxID=79200 RepID=A0A166AN43_DAUCS|nr:hypothetical protein DCAR_0311715 [Daucus carota subsp. sativus]